YTYFSLSLHDALPICLSLAGNDLGIPLMPDNMAKEVTNRFGAANFSYNPTKEWTISGFGIISDNKTDMENWSRNQILNTETGEVDRKSTRLNSSHVKI